MTDHPEEETLHAYLDGELTAEEVSAVAAHLQACGSCRDRTDRLRSLFLVIESVPEQRLERSIAPQVMRTLHPTLRWLPSLAFGELVAALAIAAALLVGIGRANLAVNLAGTAQRWIAILENGVAAVSTYLSRAPAWLPDFTIPAATVELPALQYSWIYAAGAMVLWALGNGLVLRRVRRED